MPLPALLIREKILYKDLFWAYTPTEDSNGNTNGYVLATLSHGFVGPVAAIPCNAHLTPNFDQPRSPAGQDKVTSFETSNLLTCQRQMYIDPDWVLFVKTRWGDANWFKTDGDVEREVLVPCSCVFLVPSTAPPGVSPPA
jgi:hypothetical protein